MTFNILQGGGNAKNAGFGNELFDGSRIDEIASAIHLAKADAVGVQEDCPPKSNAILKELGEGWHRSGSVYSKYPLRPVGNDRYLNIVDAELPKSRVIRVINCHWWPNKYGPSLAQTSLGQIPKRTWKPWEGSLRQEEPDQVEFAGTRRPLARFLMQSRTKRVCFWSEISTSLHTSTGRRILPRRALIDG